MNWKFLNQPLGRCDLSGGYAPEKKHFWPILAAAASLGSTIFGGITSSNANKKAQRQLDAEKAVTQNERRRKYYENPLDRPDVQNLIRVAQQQADKIWKREQGASAVAGSTEANSQMAKEAGNQMVADVTSNIAANDATRKDMVDAQYRSDEKQLAQQQMALDRQKGQNIADAAGQAASAIGQLALSYAGTKMGAGSPAGGGVSPTPGQTGGALNNMGGTVSTNIPLTNEMKIANYYKTVQGLNQNYSNVAQNAQLWRNNWLGDV